MTKLGESNQESLSGKIPATAAGTMLVAMQQVATRTGDPDLIMDPKVMPTITKAGTRQARTAIVLREGMLVMAKARTSRAHTGTVLRGEVQTGGKAGVNKAQLAIVPTEGTTTGAVLQDPSQLLTLPGPRATPVADGAMETGLVAKATRPTIMALQAACQVLGTAMQDHNLGRAADPTNHLKIGTVMVVATLPLLATMAARVGAVPPARVVVKVGEEGATEVESRRTIGMLLVEAPEENGTATHQTTLDRRTVTHGASTPRTTPKVRRRIGSGSTGVGLGIHRVIAVVSGGD